jgi:ABC-type dipeptide/oligopeptide/nickel transport system ATPase component
MPALSTDVHENKEQLNKKQKILEVKNLSTHFQTREGILRAVDGLTYYVYKGECVGLVGESACGKSVSALSILRLIPNPPGKIIGGEINFDGKESFKGFGA